MKEDRMDNILPIIIFMLVFGVFFILVGSYFSFSFVKPFGFSRGYNLVLSFLLSSPFILMPASLAYKNNHDSTQIYENISLVIMFLLGFVFVLFSLLVFRDLIFRLVFFNLFDFNKAKTINITSVCAVVLSVFLVIKGHMNVLKTPEVKNVKVKTQKSELKGFKIVEIVDLHIVPFIKDDWIKSVVKKVNSLDADIVVIPGDLVDRKYHEIIKKIELLKEIKAKKGVFFVTGNHEYYSGVYSWKKAIQELDIEVLYNQNKIIPYNGQKIMIAGIRDYSAGKVEKDIKEALATDQSDIAYKILLAHQPKGFKYAIENQADLQISGHTHGGQIFPFGLLVKLAQPFVSGLHKRENTNIYVSRGTGYWGVPMRLLAPSEITEIVLD
jgi:hypothetical protein